MLSVAEGLTPIQSGLTNVSLCNIIVTMATSDKLTKKELKQLQKLEKLRKQSFEQKQNMTKWVVIGISSVLFLALFVGLIIAAKTKKQSNQTAATTSTSFENTGHIKGNATAAATLTEFADFQCPACKAYHPIVNSLMGLYPDDLKLQYKQFPISAIHRNAVAAGVAAEAAGRQNKFFEMGDILFDNQADWEGLPAPQDKFIQYAKDLKLNIDKFKKDIQDKSLIAVIEEMRNEGIKKGVNATPTFFINGKKITNPSDISAFQKIVDAELDVKKVLAPKISPTATPVPSVLPLQ